MADLNALKAQLKEQNQRLLSVTQEKARLEAKNKISQMREEEGVGKSSFIFLAVWSFCSCKFIKIGDQKRPEMTVGIRFFQFEV